jgi:heptosyltransferase-3
LLFMTIAIVRTDRLGDMILTLPMIGAIRSVMPDARILLYTRRYVEPIVRSVAGIDEIIYCDDADVDLRRSFREQPIDVIFFPRPRRSEAWAAVMARIPQRVGSAYRWYSFLFTTRIRDHRSTAEHHEAEYNVRMIEAALRLAALPVALPTIRPLTSMQVPERPYFVVHPGSGGSARDWAPERFGEAARELAAQTGWQPVITGIASEQGVCDVVQRTCPTAINLCGARSLEEMMSVLVSAEVLIANSTGVLHVAAALRTAVVGLYPRTPAMSQYRWGPYTGRAVVLESDAADDMSTIDVSAVVNAARRAHALHPAPYQRPGTTAPSPHK